MAKKGIEEAIKEAHEAADEAIDELQEELTDARNSVMEWLHTERTYKQAELLVFGVGILAIIWAVGSL